MILLLLCTALAGPLSHWGAGESGFSAATATDDGPYAAWTNPAAMQTDRIESSVDLVAGSASLDVDGAPVYAQAAPGLSVGATLNGYFANVPAAHLGIALHLPVVGPYGWSAEPEAIPDTTEPLPQVPRFSQDLTRLEAAVAGNIWVADSLSIGFGVDVSASIETLTDVIIDDLAAPEDALRAQDVTIKPTFHPYLGIIGIIGDQDQTHVRIGALGRTGRRLKDFGTSNLLFGSGAFVYRHNFVRFYAPPTGTLSVDLRVPGTASFRAETSLEAWSVAPGPYGEDLGESWTNSVVTRVGLRGDFAPVHPMIGYSYDPGPAAGIAPNSLHLDGASHVFTGGLGARVFDQDGQSMDVHAGALWRLFPESQLQGHSLNGHLAGVRAGMTMVR